MKTLFLLCTTLLCLVAAAPPAHGAPDGDKKRARALFAKANAFYARGMYLDALKHYRQARALYPSFKIDLNIGGTLDAMGRLTEAAVYFEKFMLNAGQADPAVIKEAQKRLRALQRKLGRVTVTSLESGARVLLDGKAVGITPLDLPVYVIPGKHTFAAQKAGFTATPKELALAAGQRAELDLPLTPTKDAPAPAPATDGKSSASGSSGTSSSDTGDDADATVHYYKGLALKKQGKRKEAMAEFAAALEAQPKFAPAHHSIGILYRKAGKIKEALFHLEKAAALRPDYAETRYSLGVAYYWAKRKTDALAAFQAAARLDPKDPRPREQAGILLERRDPKKALPYFEEAVKLAPKEVRYQRRLGQLQIKLKQYDQARATLERAAKIKTTAEVAFSLGLLKRQLGKYDQAVPHYKKAIALDPKMPAAYWDLADVYNRLGKPAEAERVYTALIKIDEKSPAAARARREILKLKGGK